MYLSHKYRAFLLVLISVSVLINPDRHNSQPTHDAEFCYDPSDNATDANFQTNLASLLDSLSSKAALHSFYIYSISNSLFGLFLCRGDVSRDTCQNCTRTACQEIRTRCASNTSAIIWYTECMLRYSRNNFFGEAQTFPRAFMWSDFINRTSPEQSDIDARALMYPVIKEASTTDMLFKTRESLGEDESRNRYGLVQCTRDIDGALCSSCLSQLMIEALECCVHKGGWRILAPSCNLRYEEFLFYQQASAPPSEIPVPPGLQGNKTTIIVLTIVLSVAVVASLLGLVCYLHSRRKRRLRGEEERNEILLSHLESSNSLNYQEQEINTTNEDSNKVHCFSLTAIRISTKDFSDENKLGEGGFGPVFKGELPDGKVIAVKRLSPTSKQGPEEFENEVALIGEIRHRNLLRLWGCCKEKGEKLLVYEYMPNGSLAAFLFDPTKHKELDWPKREEIIHGIGKGLQYLHEDSPLKTIHRDIKASNVLLDEEMKPKISDYGNARIFRGNENEAFTYKLVGTFGYMAPEYARSGKFSNKSDVYSYGVLILEIVSGIESKGFSHPSGAQSLPSYAWRLWSEGKGLELVEPDLVHSCPTQALRWIHIGLLCVQDDPNDRPTISSVVLLLGNNTILPRPSEPTFSLPNCSVSNQSSSTGQHSGFLTCSTTASTGVSWE